MSESVAVAGGEADKFGAVADKEHEDSLRQRTGLTREQRDQVRMTPLLLANLDNVDLRVAKAARGALAKLWKGASGASEDATPEQWRKVWDSHKDRVKEAANPTEIAPLVSPERLSQANPTHDE